MAKGSMPTQLDMKRTGAPIAIATLFHPRTVTRFRLTV
jgi:hypothetical protein